MAGRRECGGCLVRLAEGVKHPCSPVSQTAGMAALYEVRPCSRQAPAPRLAGRVRQYYIAAKEVQWDYGPSGLDPSSGKRLSEAGRWVQAGGRGMSGASGLCRGGCEGKCGISLLAKYMPAIGVESISWEGRSSHLEMQAAVARLCSEQSWVHSLTHSCQESQLMQNTGCHICLWASFLLAVPNREQVRVFDER